VIDTLTRDERSKRMSLVRSKDTKPELVVRHLVYGLGYRYRLHRSDLPGKPDLVFFSRRKVIFIHGCFWHRHQRSKCKLARLPKSRLDFWLPKLEKNRVRDKINQTMLRRLGWKVLVAWECELGDVRGLRAKIVDFLSREPR
jgi:DNA mismatch endonuclease (patch repair protein)